MVPDWVTRSGYTEELNRRTKVGDAQQASRVAFVQLGQQMQDVVIQAQLGTNAMTIFAQQVPQAAFALTGLADSANATQRRIGAIATFTSMLLLFLILTTTWIKTPDVFYKKREPGSDPPP